MISILNFMDGYGIFFFTSHGKNAYHGIGGVVKRSVAKVSLQLIYCESRSNINSWKFFLLYCESNISGINFIAFSESLSNLTVRKIHHTNYFKIQKLSWWISCYDFDLQPVLESIGYYVACQYERYNIFG